MDNSELRFVSTLGGGFFIPVSEVRAVPMGQHIHLDINGKPSLSKDYVYLQPQLSALIQNGGSFPESVLTAGSKKYPLVSGSVHTNRVVGIDPANNKGLVCFRSIANLINSCGPDTYWITFGTIGDLIENAEEELVIFDPGLPTANIVPVAVIKAALKQDEQTTMGKTEIVEKPEKKKSFLGKLLKK